MIYHVENVQYSFYINPQHACKYCVLKEENLIDRVSELPLTSYEEILLKQGMVAISLIAEVYWHYSFKRLRDIYIYIMLKSTIYVWCQPSTCLQMLHPERRISDRQGKCVTTGTECGQYQVNASPYMYGMSSCEATKSRYSASFFSTTLKF